MLAGRGRVSASACPQSRRLPGAAGLLLCRGDAGFLRAALFQSLRQHRSGRRHRVVKWAPQRRREPPVAARVLAARARTPSLLCERHVVHCSRAGRAALSIDSEDRARQVADRVCAVEARVGARQCCIVVQRATATYVGRHGQRPRRVRALPSFSRKQETRASPSSCVRSFLPRPQARINKRLSKLAWSEGQRRLVAGWSFCCPSPLWFLLALAHLRRSTKAST